MLKLALLPARASVRDHATDALVTNSSQPRPERHPEPEPHRYYAFLSYSHKDQAIADWLHRELERFRVPRSLAGRLTANGVVPRRLTPIFRDRHELAAADDLGAEIRSALTASQFLIVLCSPDAAKSRWTNAEIEAFKRSRPEGCVLAAIVAGEPFASDIPGREDEECFPPALRHKYDRRGRPTGKRAEPLAADLRDEGDGRRIGFLKLVAGMIGVRLDELVQRETTRRHRRLGYLAAASLAGMAVTSTLAVTAIQARDAARDQRREAEGLIGFMLGDLKDKLEPIGKLDALDGVGARVLAYYQKQDASELSDAALSQRSKALSLTAEVAMLRGDTDTALNLYREALTGTAEAMRRKRNDPQRLFDHAQNEFWLGQIAINKGSLNDAEPAFREYKRLADRMVALDPDNMKWRMEVQNADANLGGLLDMQRRFPEAAAQYGQAFQMIEALTTADPRNRDYQQSLVESLAWYADAEKDAGHLAHATVLRERHVALLSQLARSGDVSYTQKLIPAERALGNLYAARGRIDLGTKHLRAAVEYGDRLTLVEPNNTNWLALAAKAKINLAEFLLLGGVQGEATASNEAGCSMFGRLVAKDSTMPEWRAGLRDCWMMRAQLAMANRAMADAVSASQQAVQIARLVHGTDREADRYLQAKAYRLLGDARQRSGDSNGARAAWQTAFAVLPTGVSERPGETKIREEVMQRLGRNAEAQQMTKKLAAIGYLYPSPRT